MATNAFSDAFRQVMTQMARETLESELAWMLGPSIMDPIDPKRVAEARNKAKERVAALTDDQVYEVLEATAPKPCPECGCCGH